MAPQKSPAFQFYAKDFQTGTASMSLQEVGAYIRLLAYQWDTGSIPSEPSERARILGCAKAQERDLWKKVGKKFVLVNDVYLNERLETERQKQTEYRRRQSDKGRASAAAKNQPSLNRASTEPQPALLPEGQPKGNSPVSGLQSPSDSTNESQQQHAAPLIRSAIYVDKRRQHCAFVGSKIEVPNGLHAELRKNHGGANPEKELQDWYLAVNERAEDEAWRIPVDKDFFPWFKALYAKRFPVTNGVKDNSALMARLEAIERGEIKR